MWLQTLGLPVSSRERKIHAVLISRSNSKSLPLQYDYGFQRCNVHHAS